jgi:hypothetical protein
VPCLSVEVPGLKCRLQHDCCPAPPSPSRAQKRHTCPRLSSLAYRHCQAKDWKPTHKEQCKMIRHSTRQFAGMSLDTGSSSTAQ